MIHIATTHWKGDQWVEIQQKYLRRFIEEPYQVYAFVGDARKDYRSQFFFYSTEELFEGRKVRPMVDHPIRLNFLADVIRSHAEPHELLIFLDGDAFPIMPFVDRVRELVHKHQLVAIRRDENKGEEHPHPAFCATTVGFWEEIQGNWRPGFPCISGIPGATDVGGNLLNILRDKKIEWYPVLRSNKKNIHSLWFGLYGGMIYHHGAGFRAPCGRIDHQDDWFKEKRFFRSLHAKNWSAFARFFGRIYFWEKWRRERDQITSRHQNLRDSVWNKIGKDDEFWREFA